MASLKLFLFCIFNVAFVAVAYEGSESVLPEDITLGEPWPEGTVYYHYDFSVTARLQKEIRHAMDVWENATCLNFEHSADDDVLVFYYYPNEEYCTSSSIGYVHGRPIITLGYSCQTVGDLLHHLGFAIGLCAEQNRLDRNRYISINTDNIEDGQEGNFAICSNLKTGYQGVGYDYASIMHLSTSAYSNHGTVTIEVVNRDEYVSQGSPKLGNREGLSRGDKLKVNRLYNCPGVGLGEVLNVDLGSLKTELPGEYAVVVIGVDGDGRTQNLSSTIAEGNTTVSWNETLKFQVNTAKWQFFRIMVKALPEDSLISMVETVGINVGMFEIDHDIVLTELRTAELSFSYECTADRNDCEPNPCVATGCNDELFDYSCDCREGFGGKNCNIQCPRGYSGYNCTTDVSGNSCLPHPCTEAHSHGCTDGFFDHTCYCFIGYGGKNCEIVCPLGYTGRNCERDISGDSCLPNPCHAWRSIGCVDKIYDYNCTCSTGFGGKNCERACPYGFGGYNCDLDVSGDSCASNPCNSANTVSCTDGFFDYTCNCRTGYGGKQCTRVCPRGYDGYSCNIDISGDSCASNPCHSRNTRRCIDGFFDYTCQCNAGYGGKTCSTDLCASGLCNNNGGSCIPYRYSPNYRCVCPLAWTPASQCTVWEPRCLEVVIKSARGLDDKDGFLKGDSDPYTRITAYSSTGHSASGKTRYIQGDESPTWNHRFRPGCGHSWERFYFRIYDDDIFSDDKLSSGQSVYLSSLGRFPRCSLTVNVRGGGGSIKFDVYYYNRNGPGQPGSC